jgi:3-oxoacyl-[acyl-carrier protein] reductase
MTGRLDGRVALITGASRGFGRATALRFAEEGADLVLNYRSAEADARSIAEEAERLGRRVAIVQADVASTEETLALGRKALEAFGRIDILVNNAGVMDVRPFVEQDPSEWRRMNAINVDAVLTLTHAILPAMIEQGPGRIVCLSSQLGHVGGANFAVYSGTKGYILAFVKSLAREVGQYGITVNAVCPGSILTDMNRSVYPPDKLKARLAELPLRRMGETNDIAESVLYLAADSGKFVTGACIEVNGGSTMV